MRVTLEQLETDPHPVLAQLRPIAWVPVLNGWLVTGRELALQVMRDDETFTVDDPRFSTGRVVGQSMLTRDGAAHARHRDPFAAPLRLGAVRERFAPLVESVTGVAAGNPPTPKGAAAFEELRATVEPALESSGDLTPAEVVSNAAVMMFGGIETTEGMLVNLVWHL